MNDHFRRVYVELLDRTPEPPTWSDVAATRVVPAHHSTRSGPLVAITAGVGVVVLIGVVAGLFQGASTFFAPPTVDYVRIAWSQAVEPRCLGMDVRDTGGFDSATIEVWGPNADGRYRADITAPDGSVERVVADVGVEGDTRRAWATYPMIGGEALFEEATAFRSVECVTSDGRTSYGVTDSPYVPTHIPGLAFMSPRVGASLSSGNESVTEVRSDEWRGNDVVVYVTRDTSAMEVGDRDLGLERWVDPATDLLQRMVFAVDVESLGHFETVSEVVDRQSVQVDDDHFSVEGLVASFDRSEMVEAGEAVTTTSIVPTAHPLMTDAVEVEPDDIANPDLHGVIDPREGDRLLSVPLSETTALLVRLRPGARPHMYATSCGLLTSVDLPDGWDGTCTELVREGSLEVGRFGYAAAVSALGG